MEAIWSLVLAIQAASQVVTMNVVKGLNLDSSLRSERHLMMAEYSVAGEVTPSLGDSALTLQRIPPTLWRAHDRRVSHHVLLRDRKSTRLNSSHANISYAVFCLKKKKQLIHS